MKVYASMVMSVFCLLVGIQEKVFARSQACVDAEFDYLLVSIAWQDYSMAADIVRACPSFVNRRGASDGLSSLMLSVYVKNSVYGGSYEDGLKIVRLLLENGANVNAQTESGHSALHGAAWWGDYNVVRLLVDHGADITLKAKNGDTPLIVALSVVGSDFRPRVNQRIVELLLVGK